MITELPVRKLGNTGGNINQRVSWRSVAHYGASSLWALGFSGGGSKLIMPGSRVRGDLEVEAIYWLVPIYRHIILSEIPEAVRPNGRR